MKKNAALFLYLWTTCFACLRADLEVQKTVWASGLSLDTDTKRGLLEPRVPLKVGSQGYPIWLWINVVNDANVMSSPEVLTVEVSYRRIVCDQAGAALACHLEWDMAAKRFALPIDPVEPKSTGGRFRTGFRTKDTQDVEDISIRILDKDGNVLAGTTETPISIEIK
jgi:hypothetical protein